MLPASINNMLWRDATADCTYLPNNRTDSGALASQGVQNVATTRFRPTVMNAKHATLRAPEAVAPHRAAHGTNPPIEAALTNAHCTMRRAVAVLPTFCTTSRAASHNIV